MNYKITSISDSPRVELKESLNLSGAEISINTLPAKSYVPFVHSHKENEEIYIIFEGEGKLFIDGKEESIKKGNIFAVKPSGKRAIKAVSELKFACIQVKEGSLKQWTKDDGIINEDIKPSWF